MKELTLSWREKRTFQTITASSKFSNENCCWWPQGRRAAGRDTRFCALELNKYSPQETGRVEELKPKQKPQHKFSNEKKRKTTKNMFVLQCCRQDLREVNPRNRKNFSDEEETSLNQMNVPNFSYYMYIIAAMLILFRCTSQFQVVFLGNKTAPQNIYKRNFIFQSCH